MNALQLLIRSYLDEHPDETYVSIATRGDLKPGTVWAIAKRPRKRQLTEPAQLRGLAQGMGVPLAVVEDAARQAAGGNSVETVQDDDDLLILLSTSRQLSPDRKRELARRARFLLEEQSEEQGRSRRQ